MFEHQNAHHQSLGMNRLLRYQADACYLHQPDFVYRTRCLFSIELRPATPT
jgi:hypothetical protein